MTKLFLAVLMSIGTLGIAATAAASEKPENITEAEWALLPPYCPYTMGFKGHKQPHIAKWSGIMGEGFFHMHHYCWALIDLRRAERSGLPATDRKFLRGRALGGFQYVVRNAPEDFVLAPEIYTWIGRTEILLDRPKNAFEAFSTARQLKPDYWPPYYHWAEFLQSHGKRAEALEIIRSGLQFSPEAKSLLLLYRQLGGKPSDIPKPTAQVEAKSADENTGAEIGQDNDKPSVQ
ncbi:MAG: tetratricopeptide repeat protein [Propionivibrio sp.]